MDLDRVKQLMRQGVSYEKAYGFCMQQLARAENQIPNHKVQEARRSSATSRSLASQQRRFRQPRDCQENRYVLTEQDTSEET